MNKQQLASKIWESANKMRSKIEANEYKDYILGFIFYKFLSEKEVNYLKDNDWTDEDLPDLTEEDTETVKSVQRNIGYFISYDNLFSTWLNIGSDFSIQDVHDALSAFNRLIDPVHKRVFEGIFDTLQTGLSKLGDSSASRSKAVMDLIHLIKDIPMDGKQDYDVLGFIYEYLISMFAANAGKKAGEFYTPHEVSILMSEIIANYLKNKTEIKIYDPTSGSGSLLINIGKSISKYIQNENNIKYYAQELKQNTYNLTRMNLVMRGILPDNIVTRNADTLEDDWPYFDENDPVGTYDPLYVDAVVSNPPYSQSWDPIGKDDDPRYSRFGVAPKSKADYAFLLHDLFHVKSGGIMTIVLPHGVLFRGGEEGEIRKNLIEANHIDAIIGLPANIFFGTSIPTIIMILKKKRENTDVLIVDASKGFIKEGKTNKLRSSDIKKIVDVVVKREDVDKFSRKVSRDVIRKNDYNLNIPRYVDSSEPAESWDIYASMFGGIPVAEIDSMTDVWNTFPHLKQKLFENTSSGYYRLITDDVKNTIKNNIDVQMFENDFLEAFSMLNNMLYEKLIKQIDTVNPSIAENDIAEEIFNRMMSFPLIDKYEAYQLLDDAWKTISGDIEILQTEGFESAKKVDPNIVIKRKNGKDQEVQEGWVGHIFPFSLVQDEFLTEEAIALKTKENRLSEISSEYEELFESLTEEEKAGTYVGEDGFVFAEIKKALKSDSLEPETMEKLTKVSALSAEEKNLKKAVKDNENLLHIKTKEMIEMLGYDEIEDLLCKKWFDPILRGISEMPDKIVNDLVSRIESIQKKYDETITDIESQILDEERSLSSMIDELKGNEFDMKGLAELKALLGGELNV